MRIPTRATRAAVSQNAPAGEDEERTAPCAAHALKPLPAHAFGTPPPLRDDQRMRSLAGSRVPLPIAALSAQTRAALVRELPRNVAKIARDSLHPGIDNPFDFAAVVRNRAPQVQAAMAAYVHPDFTFASAEQKRALLEVLRPVLLPERLRALERFHLPRAVAEASRMRPITLALEAEAPVRMRPETLDFYAPSPNGLLDPRVMSPAFFAQIEAHLTPRPPLWARLGTEQRAALVRWKDLSDSGRIRYLERMQASTDPSVTLHRIESVSAAPTGKLAPSTLSDRIKWETSGALKTAEIITKSHYVSRDQLCRDEAFVRDGIGGKPPGFHYHCVLELDSVEDKQALGPKVASVAGFTDLFLFAHGMRSGCNLLDHKHLEVFTAEGVLRAMDAFGGERIAADALLEHKFHLVGIRQGEAMYGNDNRVGLEIRGVPVGHTSLAQHLLTHTLDIMSSKALREVDTDFWLGWNAGDKRLPKERYDTARAAAPADVRRDAALSFEEVFEYALDGRKTKDHFRFSAPFWSFETLPGASDEDKARIQAARSALEARYLRISVALTRAIESGRELKPAAVYAELHKAIATFFASSRVDRVIARYLRRLALEGEA